MEIKTTTTIIKNDNLEFGTSCICCGEFIKLPWPNYRGSENYLCSSCKDTIMFVKANRSKLEEILK